MSQRLSMLFFANSNALDNLLLPPFLSRDIPGAGEPCLLTNTTRGMVATIIIGDIPLNKVALKLNMRMKSKDDGCVTDQNSKDT